MCFISLNPYSVLQFGGWNSYYTDSKFSQFTQGYSAELSQVVESEFNHYLLSLNIGSQTQRNVRNVVVARKTSSL